MQITDLDPEKHPFVTQIRYEGRDYLVTYAAKSHVNLFLIEGAELHPFGAIDCTQPANTELERVKKWAIEGHSAHSLFARLNILAAKITEALQVAKRFDSEDYSSRDLLLIITKLEEAEDRVRRAIAESGLPQLR